MTYTILPRYGAIESCERWRIVFDAMRHFFKTMWAIGFYFREEAIFSNGEMPKWIASTTVNSGNERRIGKQNRDYRLWIVNDFTLLRKLSVSHWFPLRCQSARCQFSSFAICRGVGNLGFRSWPPSP